MAGELPIVKIGGTTARRSATEQALGTALAAAEWDGAKIRLFDGAALASLPRYRPGAQASAGVAELLAARQVLDLAQMKQHGRVLVAA